MDVRFAAATPADEPAIRTILKDAGLPHEDFAVHLSSFIMAKEGDTVIGAIGMEVYGGVALLRSLAVAAARRGAGVGGALCARMEHQARGRGVETLYLLTQTAENFFASHGYRAIPREEAPAAIRQTGEFALLCPRSAICMKKEIRQTPAR